MQMIIIQFVHFQINYQLKCKSDLQCSMKSITIYVMPVISIIKVSTFKLNSHTVRFMVDCD